MKALRWWPYLVLSLTLVVSLIVYLVLSPALGGPRDFTLNLATEIVGILLTVGLIDAVIRRRELRERKRYRSVALRQLWRPLHRHLELLFNIYKASVEQKPDRQILQVKDLFNDDYIEQTKRFDITSDSPESASVGIDSDLKPWSDYLRQEVKRFKDELERIVDKYAMYLDPDTLDVAEQLIDSSFVGIIDYGPTLVAHVRSLGHHESFPLFVTPGAEDVVREYIDAFSDLVEIYNREASSDRKVRITEELWRNDELPKIGSARISHLLTGADLISNDASPRTESEQQT